MTVWGPLDENGKIGAENSATQILTETGALNGLPIMVDPSVSGINDVVNSPFSIYQSFIKINLDGLTGGLVVVKEK